ncbi:signal peptidase I [Alkalibacillus aidingensis]|uniref:signal peptidase I n=1 Tax=Alkalibacillus aidingensis TaxID=2747607 RepID=UPI0016615ADD|nr:signal peptidase I [Alkalibacillus aidingensis]
MEEKKKQIIIKEVISWGKTIAIAIVVVLVCRYFLMTPVSVQGESMFPTLEQNNKLVVTKITPLERFDLLVFDSPDHDDEQYIKRIIGLPGDTVEMRDDVLIVNDEVYNESYVNKEVDGETPEKITNDFTLEDLTERSVVPEGHYFVLGDNRMRSRDSRDFGFISEDLVIGEAKFRFYPFTHFGVVE